MQRPRKRTGRTPRRAVLAAIRKGCLGCVESWKQVERCEITDCCLWPVRFGVVPETAAKQGKLVDPKNCTYWEDMTPEQRRQTGGRDK